MRVFVASICEAVVFVTACVTKLLPFSKQPERLASHDPSREVNTVLFLFFARHGYATMKMSAQANTFMQVHQLLLLFLRITSTAHS